MPADPIVTNASLMIQRYWDVARYQRNLDDGLIVLDILEDVGRTHFDDLSAALVVGIRTTDRHA